MRPSDIWTIIVLDVCIALEWLLMSPNRTIKSHVYDAPRAVFDWAPMYPIRAWGLVLAMLVAVFTFASLKGHLSLRRQAVLAMTLYWTWWAISWLVASGTSGTTSMVASTFAVGWAIRHFRMIDVRLD